MPEPGAIAVKVGVQLLTRVAPTGLAWVSTWYKGKRLAIVGQPGAGKTSFLRYMQFGVFADPSMPRQPTEDDSKSAAFSVKSGKDNMLQLQVRSILDTVGQVNARDHARAVIRHKPHALVIVLDISGQWEGDNNYSSRFYVSEFLENLAHELDSRAFLARHPSNITVLLNKSDKVDAAVTAEWAKQVRQSLNTKLAKFGPAVKKIPVLPCSLIEDKGGALPEKVIRHLALSLQ